MAKAMVSEEAIRKLNTFSTQDRISKEVFDLLALGKLSTKDTSGKFQTEVDGLLNELQKTHGDCRSSIVQLLQKLRDLKLGRFIIGRIKKKSRMEWYVDPASVGKAAQGKLNKLEFEFNPEADLNGNPPMIPYEFLLRSNLRISFSVPEDITHSEAERFSAYIRSCLIIKES